MESFRVDYILSAIRTYALDEWVKHLQHVVDNLNSVDAQDKAEIGKLLCKMLMNVNWEMFYVYSAPYPLVEFISQQNLDLIVTFLADKACVDGIEDREMKTWIQSCITTPPTIFVPLGREAAKEWLVESENPYQRWACMVTVWTVMVLLDGGNVKDMPPSPSVETALAVARWAQREENAVWHHRVGERLGDLEHYDAAIKQMETSLELQPMLWAAKKELALIYGRQGRLDDSIRLQKECETRCVQLLAENEIHDEKSGPESVENRDLADIRDGPAMTYIELGDSGNALHWFRACVETRDTVYLVRALAMALRILISSQEPDHREIMRLLKSLDRRLYDWTFISHCFEDMLENRPFYLIYTVAAEAAGELQWLESKYKDAVARTKRRGQDVTTMCLEEVLACLYDRFLDEEDKVVPIWRRIKTLSRVPSTLQYKEFIRYKNSAISSYAYRLFSNALNASEESQERHIHELEKLYKDVVDSLSDTGDILGNYSAIYMGVWHRIHGREAEARDYFKPYVRQALLHLCDTGTDDSMGIYDVLGHLLTMVDDDANATAVFQLPHSDFSIRDGTSASSEERMASPWLLFEYGLWYCDGCLKLWGNYTHCNICRYCRADLCQECLDVIKQGHSIPHACDISHTWLHIPAPTSIPDKGQIIREGEVLSINEFKTLLEKDWI